MANSNSSAPIYNYLEKWSTRYGLSERVVTRQSGRFLTNISLTALRKAKPTKD